MYGQPHDPGAGAEHNNQNFLSATSAVSTFSQTQFPSPLFSVDPRLHGSPQHLRPQQAIPPEARRASNDSANSMQPPSASPQQSRATPVSGRSSISRPAERALPPKDVTAETITDAFVSFVLYCNPQFPLDVDTSSLRTGFEGPPKSDNKEFKTFRLFELIQKFDAKEIKTWGQLALDLGVEAPDISKGQSVQKVQQYSVRLKRWMRAMHIDAFFEYLLGKQHVYFTDIPPPHDPYPTAGRDGVTAEEDLAVRALDPAFRPKRGRRRNSETEQDEGVDGGPASKQPRLDRFGQPQSAFPSSSIPMSAHPDGGFNDPWASAVSAITPRHAAPWGGRGDVPQSAIATTAPSQSRWQLHGNSQTPLTPHPMTALPTSMAAHIDSAFDDDPRSAINPSGRRRRKHGPSVSSAWNSTNTPGAKPRGRPPANRNIQDGPFSTFPADPGNDRSTNNNPPPETALTSEPQPLAAEIHPGLQMAPPLPRRQSDGPGRPGRLSLQVPQHTGGPVRLATPPPPAPPPPRLLVNGDPNDSDSRPGNQTPPIITNTTNTNTNTSTQQPRTRAPKIRTLGNLQIIEREIPGFMFETLKRILTSDLLRAELIGRHQRLTSDEAKRLADAVLDRLGVPRQDTDSSRDDIARLTAASWLGLGEHLNVPLGPATSRGKRIVVTRFRCDAEGYEEIVSAFEERGETVEATRDVFDLSWTVSLANCNGSFELKGLEITSTSTHHNQNPNPNLNSTSSASASASEDPDAHDSLLQKSLLFARQLGNNTDPSTTTGRRTHELSAAVAKDVSRASADGVDWKAKYMALEIGATMAVGELKRMKGRVVERVLDVLLDE